MGERRTIVIAGAGIGGLTAALALARAGFGVIIAERNAELSELGAGIQLSPNAGRVLASLGLDEAIARLATEPAAIDIRRSSDGRRLASILLATFRDRYHFPYRSIHRADLQKVLADAVIGSPAITLHLGATIGDWKPQAGGYLVGIERAGGRDIVPAIAIVGADGVWSALRKRIAGASTPRPSGRTAWRALLAVDNAPPGLDMDRIGLWLGEKSHLVHYPVNGGAAINIVAIVEEAWDKQGWNSPGDRKVLLAHFAGWAEGALDLLRAPFGWQKYAIATLDPSGPWTSPPLALLGDAAHAMTPFVAQGAAMAIEDAAVLANALGTTGDVASALKKYETARKERVASVARTAARTGAVYHWALPLASLRNAALQAAGAPLVLAQNDWIYRWQV